MSGAIAWFAALTGVIVAGVLISMLKQETEGWINALPECLLQLARARLPASHRDTLYDEWTAELHIALHDTEGRPLTRLVLGIRYAAGLIRSGRRVAEELGPARLPRPEQAEGVHPETEGLDHLAADVEPSSAGRSAVSDFRSGPSVVRILLGIHLRRLREARSITWEEAGRAIQGGGSKIARMEQGVVDFEDRDVIDLLSLYGITDPQIRKTLIDLIHHEDLSAWWQRSAAWIPGLLEPYIALEHEASEIHLYEVHQIPALLQTAEYARALTCHSRVTEAGQSQKSAEFLEARQAVLRRSHRLHLRAVIDEAVLRRPIGDEEVLRGQLRHLIELSSLDGVTIQIVSLAKGVVAAGGSFSILRFAGPCPREVVYLEQLTSTVCLENRSQVEPYDAMMANLTFHAESGWKAVEILRNNLAML